MSGAKVEWQARAYDGRVMVPGWGWQGEFILSPEEAWRLYESLRDVLQAGGVKRPEEPGAPRTVPVRIAVCVDEAGFHRVGLTAPRRSSRQHHVVWITASVPLPQSVEVQGEVES